MSDFADFHKALAELVSKFENIKLETESENNDIIKIFDHSISSLSRAKSGLDEVTEFAITVAEHHPYWGLLYQCCQICQIALEKWDKNISKEEIEEIKWSIAQLDDTCEKLKSTI